MKKLLLIIIIWLILIGPLYSAHEPIKEFFEKKAQELVNEKANWKELQADITAGQLRSNILQQKAEALKKSINQHNITLDPTDQEQLDALINLAKGEKPSDPFNDVVNYKNDLAEDIKQLANVVSIKPVEKELSGNPSPEPTEEYTQEESEEPEKNPSTVQELTIERPKLGKFTFYAKSFKLHVQQFFQEIFTPKKAVTTAEKFIDLYQQMGDYVKQTKAQLKTAKLASTLKKDWDKAASHLQQAKGTYGKIPQDMLQKQKDQFKKDAVQLVIDIAQYKVNEASLLFQTAHDQQKEIWQKQPITFSGSTRGVISPESEKAMKTFLNNQVNIFFEEKGVQEIIDIMASLQLTDSQMKDFVRSLEFSGAASDNVFGEALPMGTVVGLWDDATFADAIKLQLYNKIKEKTNKESN